MDAFFAKIAAFFAAIATMFTAIFSQPSIVPEFPEVAQMQKQAFDEGEFVMGDYDIVVSPNGDDSAEGTLENPLRTVYAAKEKLKAEKKQKEAELKKEKKQKQGK